MAHGAPVVAVVHRLVSADRPVRLELTPLCTWRSVHGERRGGGPPQVEQTADGFVFEDAYRVEGRRLRRRRQLVPRRPRARRGGARPQRHRGPLGRRHVRRRPRARRHTRGDGRRHLGGRSSRARDRDRRGRPPAGRRARPAGRRLGRDHEAARARRRSVRDHDRRAPDRRCGLPLVRRMVARPDDVVRGPLPHDRAPRRGARGPAYVCCDGVGGHAREHGRHRFARVQHGRRHALVRSRGRPARRGRR